MKGYLMGKEDVTLKYWKASLAWKNIDDWAKGWTISSFIAEVRGICYDQGRVGDLADKLLTDVINDNERSENDIPGIIIPFNSPYKESSNIAIEG